MDEVSEQVYSQLLRHAIRVCPPDPALEPSDLVQSAWLRAHRWLDGERTEGERVKYLTTTITTAALDHRRRLKRRVATMPLEDWSPATDDVEAEVCMRDSLAVLLAVVPPSLLRFALGYPWVEIAAMCGIPERILIQRASRWRDTHDRTGVMA